MASTKEIAPMETGRPVRSPPRSPRRSRAFGRGSAMLLSCAMMAAFVLLGAAIVPRKAAEGPELYRSANSHSLRSNVLPVFIMRDDRSVVRHGTAAFSGADEIEIDLFGSTRSGQRADMEALLFESGLPALWAAVSDASQAELRRQIQSVQEEGARTATRIVTSEAFIHDYRPRLSAMLAQSLGETWEDPQTQAIFDLFLQESDPAFRRLFEAGIRDILVEGLGNTLWELARANWSNALRIPFGHGLDYGPIIEEVEDLLSNPEFRRTMIAFGRERLGSPAMRILLERMTIGSMDSLLKEPGFPLLMAEMIGDERLRRLLQPFGEAVATLAGSLPRLLGGLGGESSLNPLAAHVFRAFALGRESPLILFVKPEERRRIKAIEGEIAILLTRSQS